MDDEARKAVFGDDYDVLSRLAKIGEDMKEMEQAANQSRTARDMVMAQTLQTLGGGALGGMTGEPATALLGAGASVAAPWLAAKGLTSRGFADFALGGGLIPPAAAGAAGRMGVEFMPDVQLGVDEELARYLRELEGAR
jgi:hypothetical protein